ncbi:trypsin-like peptidase domain-containing protein [Streptomyces sp. NPDC005263]|uniref:nSTAND1 domain-containing NTPase n=1 Tax=Streptomyces sp. NPDC005263 TaxID=3364711 RepID=UPI0036A06170
MLEASQVRVCSAEGEVVGAGFLVSADVVCTCAHVVARALGVSNSAQEAPGEAVDLDFPLLESRPRARAVVVSWRYGGLDVALLRLETAVEGARPVPLVDGTGVWGHTFRALGYPVGADRGVWASGTLRAGQGSGWVQMEAQGPGPRISGGFSGSPVWDDAQDGVVGMTVAAHRGERTAYLLPSAELVDEETLRPRCPFQGLAAFTEDDAEFFHGRDSDTARVHGAVRRRSVTLVAGPSGCGKSSLVRAGVLPRLRDEGMSVSELRPVPGARASVVLARALTGVLEPELGEIDRLAKAEELAGLLETGDDVPAELRGRILARGERAGHVLFVDQLEEYAGADAATARDLFELLVALAGKDGAAVLRVIATARPDSLEALVTADTSDLVSDAVEFLAPLAAEDLERAVTAPVDAVPGLWFEPGLPERIVVDAGDEPGRMTLVQFALTELWNRRSRSMLTHAAYDEQGGVAGALVGYADDTLAGLDRPQQACARRLFVQLARPDGDAFLRRPAKVADLAPELVDLARELAPSKLLVLSRAPGGEDELVDLAHEALTRLWPRLQRWLADSRDFRAWQEQLRADLRRWQAQQLEPARLLGGNELAQADRRLAEHPADISADERGYILLSLRHSRRGKRVKQAAVGALAVLTALAVGLAASTWLSLQKTERQLRDQAAGLLAEAADDTPGSNPATALQLALAAWNTKQTPKTREALLRQYARDQYLVGSYPSVWEGQVRDMVATPDGRTLVVSSKPSGGDRWTLTVVTGALEGKIRTRVLSGVPAGDLRSAISPDGRLFAVAARNTVKLWRLSNRKDPVTLSLGKHKIAKEVAATMDFSGDGKRLLLTMDDKTGECYNRARKCVPPFAEAWEVPSGARLPVAQGLLSASGVEDAAFTTDPDTVAVTHWADSGRRAEIRDLTTGRKLYSPGPEPKGMALGGPLLRAGGEAVIAEVGGRWYAQALGRTPGPRTAIPAVSTSSDATGSYNVDGTARDGGVEKGGYADSTLTDVRTGQAYRTRLPTSGESPDLYSGVAAAPRKDGGLTVLVPVNTTLMAVRAERSGNARFHDNEILGGSYALAPDGHFLAKVTETTLEVMDASRTRLRSVRISARETSGDLMVTWTADSRWIVVWERNGVLHRAYAAQDLGKDVPLPDAVLKGKQVDSVVALRGSEIVLLTEDGSLARLDAADGTVLTQPFFAHSKGPVAGSSMYGQLMPRPGHSGQVAVVTRKGADNGEILLWDVRTPRQVAVLTGPATDTTYTDKSLGSGLVFTPDGSRLAVQNSDGQVRVWDVDRRKRLPERVPRLSMNQLIGFGPDGTLVSHVADKRLIEIRDLTDGSSVTWDVSEKVDEEITNATARITPGGHLLIDNGAGRRTFTLRPEDQFRELCTAAGRDYTKAERKLLPEGTPSGPPCP